MRWLVEVVTLGKTETESLHVDGESWQKALQAARAQRGESAPMSGFSIELSEEGCRAVDSSSRLRYDVRRAPDDGPSKPPEGPPAAAYSVPVSPQNAGVQVAGAEPMATASVRPASAPRASKRPSLSPSAAALVLGPPAVPSAPRPAPGMSSTAGSIRPSRKRRRGRRNRPMRRAPRLPPACRRRLSSSERKKQRRRYRSRIASTCFLFRSERVNQRPSRCCGRSSSSCARRLPGRRSARW